MTDQVLFITAVVWFLTGWWVGRWEARRTRRQKLAMRRVLRSLGRWRRRAQLARLEAHLAARCGYPVDCRSAAVFATFAGRS